MPRLDPYNDLHEPRAYRSGFWGLGASVPLEMAAAGLATVTSAFENQTPEAMRAISTNLITAAPTVEGVADAIAEAALRET